MLKQFFQAHFFYRNRRITKNGTYIPVDDFGLSTDTKHNLDLAYKLSGIALLSEEGENLRSAGRVNMSIARCDVCRTLEVLKNEKLEL